MKPRHDLEPRTIHHVGVRPNCSICSHPMEVLDQCILILGNDDSTGFSRFLGPCVFPDYDVQTPDQNGIIRCRKPGCCTMRNPEASTVHSDCFQFVSKRFDINSSLDRLWIATAWQTPWRQAPHFCLQETTIKPDWSLFDKIGLPQMKKLPLEIVQMIYDNSSSSSFWRFHSASLFEQQLSTSSSDQMLSIPLSTVLTWERGGQPTTTVVPHELAVFILTIDAWGIQEIKRLPMRPPLRTWRTDDRVFVVTDQWKLAGVIAHFKLGFLRLELPATSYGLQTWDTPTPPYLRQCQLHPANIRPSTHFSTFDLRQAKGLTFFYSYGVIFAIHAHTEKAPSAQKVLQQLHPTRRHLATWIYIPFPQNDSLVALGAPVSLDGSPGSFGTCWLFRMRLAGDVLVGLTHSMRARRMVLSHSLPTTLIYNEVELGPVSVIGAYSMEMQNTYVITSFDNPAVASPPLRNAFFSKASLRNVHHVSVFSNGVSGFCMGILLQYQNGAQRSLGQCRLGVDQVQHYTNPMYMCYCSLISSQSRHLYTANVTLVNFMHTQEHEHSEQGWRCFEMRGELEFWFTTEETRLTVFTDRN